MYRSTILFASFLVLVGLGGYIATSAASITALIPAFFGIALFLTLLWKQRGSIAALVLAGLGLLGSAPGLLSLVKWMGGTAPERLSAALCQSLMAIACVGFVVAFVRTPSSERARMVPAPVHRD